MLAEWKYYALRMFCERRCFAITNVMLVQRFCEFKRYANLNILLNTLRCNIASTTTPNFLCYKGR